MIMLFFQTTILPAMIVAALVLLAWPLARWRRTDEDGPVPRPQIAMIAGAIGLTLGFLVSFRFAEGAWPESPPHTAWQWIFHMAIAAGVLGAINALIPAKIPAGTRVIGFSILLGLAGSVLLHPLAEVSNPGMVKAAFGCGVLVTFAAIDPLARREAAGWLCFAFLVAFAVSALVIVESRFAKLSHLAGAMAACCGVLLAITLVWRRLPIHSGIASVFSLLLPALLVIAWMYDLSDLPVIVFLLPALVPLTLWATALPKVREWRGVRGWALRIFLVAILSVIAAVLTIYHASAAAEAPAYEW